VFGFRVFGQSMAGHGLDELAIRSLGWKTKVLGCFYYFFSSANFSFSLIQILFVVHPSSTTSWQVDSRNKSPFLPWLFFFYEKRTT
jgi:hypothetical protein